MAGVINNEKIAQSIHMIKIDDNSVEVVTSKNHLISVNSEDYPLYNIIKKSYKAIIKRNDWFNVYPSRVGSAIIPVLNKSHFLVELRPTNYFNYAGKLTVIGGILKPGAFPFENAITEFGEEILLYDVVKKILYKFNTTPSDYANLIANEYVLDVKKIDTLILKPLKLPNTQEIVFHYSDTGEEEVSYGYFFYEKEGRHAQFYYPMTLNKQLNLENIIPIHHELGGELAFFIRREQALLLRESYFEQYSLKAILKTIEGLSPQKSF